MRLPSLALSLLVHFSAATVLQLGPTAQSLRSACPPEKIFQYRDAIRSCIEPRISGGDFEICGMLRAQFDCSKTIMAECFDKDERLHNMTLNVAALKASMFVGLGAYATAHCDEGKRAARFLFDGVYGGSRECELETAFQRYTAVLQCLQGQEAPTFQSIQSTSNTREGIRRICDIAASFDNSCDSRRDYLDCMSPSLRTLVANRPLVTVQDSLGVFNESVCDVLSFGGDPSNPRLEKLLDVPFGSFKLYVEHGKFFIASPEVDVQFRAPVGIRTPAFSGSITAVGSKLFVSMALVLMPQLLSFIK